MFFATNIDPSPTHRHHDHLQPPPLRDHKTNHPFMTIKPTIRSPLITQTQIQSHSKPHSSNYEYMPNIPFIENCFDIEKLLDWVQIIDEFFKIVCVPFEYLAVRQQKRGFQVARAFPELWCWRFLPS